VSRRRLKVEHAGAAVDLAFYLAWLSCEAKQSGNTLRIETKGDDWCISLGVWRSDGPNLGNAAKLMIDRLEAGESSDLAKS
jgi:hypothetical protein